jgi:hypothetical protein
LTAISSLWLSLVGTKKKTMICLFQANSVVNLSMLNQSNEWLSIIINAPQHVVDKILRIK